MTEPTSGDTHATALRRVRQLATGGEWLALLGGLVTATWMFVTAFDPPARIAYLATLGAPDQGVPPEAALLAFCVAMLPGVLFIVALWQIRTLFHTLKRGAYFDTSVTGILVSLGWLAIATAIAGIATRTLSRLLITVSIPGHHGEVAIGISTNDMAALLLGILCLTFALVMDEGRRLDEDSRSIV